MSATLFSPITIGPISLANRIAIAPMCQYSAIDGVANSWHRSHMGSLALSGAGLFVLEATAVTPEGRITPGCLGLYSDASVDALAPILAQIRDSSDIRLGLQIGHAGRKASSNVPWVDKGSAIQPDQGGWLTLSPSGIPIGAKGAATREMTEADLEAAISAHVEAAKRALALGFDLLELHMAHGYLLSSFLSPLSNQRADRYGGDLDARLRFPLEVLRAVRAVWPKDRALAIKFNGTDWAEGGLTPDDAVPIAAAMSAAGADLVTTSGGGILPVPPPRSAMRPGYQLEAAEKVKSAQLGVKVAGVGLIYEAEQAAEIIESGRADLVSIARAFLFNPRWAFDAAARLGVDVPSPPQYLRATPETWGPARLSGS